MNTIAQKFEELFAYADRAERRTFEAKEWQNELDLGVPDPKERMEIRKKRDYAKWAVGANILLIKLTLAELQRELEGPQELPF